MKKRETQKKLNTWFDHRICRFLVVFSLSYIVLNILAGGISITMEMNFGNTIDVALRCSSGIIAIYYYVYKFERALTKPNIKIVALGCVFISLVLKAIIGVILLLLDHDFARVMNGLQGQNIVHLLAGLTFVTLIQYFVMYWLFRLFNKSIYKTYLKEISNKAEN